MDDILAGLHTIKDHYHILQYNAYYKLEMHMEIANMFLNTIKDH